MSRRPSGTMMATSPVSGSVDGKKRSGVLIACSTSMPNAVTLRSAWKVRLHLPD
jgi:hypothetical protein